MSENLDKMMDLPFIRGLVADPHGTSHKVRKFVEDLPNTLDNSSIIQGLDKLGKTNEEIAQGISDMLLSTQRGYRDVSSNLEDVSSTMVSSLEDMSLDVASEVNDLSSSLTSIYGSNLPEGKSMFEIGKKMSFDGKRTIIALAAHGGMSPYQLESIFHPNFVYYFSQGYSSSHVSSIQSSLLNNMYALHQAESKLKGEKNTIIQEKNKSQGSEKQNLQVLNELYESEKDIDNQIKEIRKKSKEIQQQLLSSDEIKLLDVAYVARKKTMKDLIASGIIHPQTLEKLITNHQVDGNMSARFARLTVKSEDGRIRPFIRLDGIAGILQETRITRKIGNVGITQREAIKEKLDNVNDTIFEGFEQTNTNLEEMNHTMYSGFHQTNDNLEQIDKTLSEGFEQTNNNLGQIDDTIRNIGELSYGIRLPQGKNLHELMENSGTEGKRTLLALSAKNLVYGEQDVFEDLFSNSFLQNLQSGKSVGELKKLQEEKKKELEILRSKQDFSKNKKNNNQLALQQKIEEIEKGMMSNEEINLLDVYQKAKQADTIYDLIEMGLLDDKSLEDLVRHQKIDGNTSLEFVRIMKIDENGVTPKLDLDGDVGRWQQLKAQTIQGNIALKQRGIVIQNLQNIGDYIQQTNIGIDRVNNNLENIGDYIQETNIGIDCINNNLESIGDQIGQTNEYLYGLLDTSIETNALLNQSNSLLEEGNEISRATNQLLGAMSNQIAFTGAQIVHVLENIGEVLVVGFNKTLDILHGIQVVNYEVLQELQKQSEILSSIDKRLASPLDTQANEYFRFGMEMLGLNTTPSIEDRTAALENFENGLKLKNTHLLNLYGAGTALTNLGKDKKAVTYLHRAYKIASKNNDTLTKKISFDLAKIHTKNFKLKIAKNWLDESIIADPEHIEAYLLKARITNILDQKEEFEILLNILYTKIVQQGKSFSLNADYQDILKYLYKPSSELVDQHIQKGLSARLLTILPQLQRIGHTEAIKNIVGQVLFLYPQELLGGEFNMQGFISAHKDYFTPLYTSYAEKKFIGGSSKNLFALAYLGYTSIDFITLDHLISVGLEYDVDYIALQHTSSSQERQMRKSNIQNKIYALGSKAKYMLRDYLKNHPTSPILS